MSNSKRQLMTLDSLLIPRKCRDPRPQTRYRVCSAIRDATSMVSTDPDWVCQLQERQGPRGTKVSPPGVGVQTDGCQTPAHCRSDARPEHTYREIVSALKTSTLDYAWTHAGKVFAMDSE